MDHLLDWLDQHAATSRGSSTPASSGRTRRTATRSATTTATRPTQVPGFRGHADRDAEIGHAPAGRHGHRRCPGVGCPIDDRDRRQLVATYYGMMAEVDDQLARLFGWLDRSGQADDTLVVLTSDHGDQMGDHWLVREARRTGTRATTCP